MEDSRTRFTVTADSYHRYRPSYPPELIDWILAETGVSRGATVADVGCGTGISTRLLAARGLDVIGVDPNEEMLAYARKEGGARYQAGEATATGLPAASVSLVTAAQAFHWFDVPAALAEFKRILRPGGWGAAFWNKRTTGPFMDEYEALLQAQSTDYKKVKSFDQSLADLRSSPDVASVREAEFPSRQALDREGFWGRLNSVSYVAHGIADRPAFDRAAEALFDRHQQGGQVEFLYRTVALLWQPAPRRGL